jgi:hypothetical protein
VSDTARRAGREQLSDAAGAVMAEAAAWGVEVEGGRPQEQAAAAAEAAAFGTESAAAASSAT